MYMKYLLKEIGETRLERINNERKSRRLFFVRRFNYFVFVFFLGTAASCLFVFTSVVDFLPVAVLLLVFVPCETF